MSAVRLVVSGLLNQDCAHVTSVTSCTAGCTAWLIVPGAGHTTVRHKSGQYATAYNVCVERAGCGETQARKGSLSTGRRTGSARNVAAAAQPVHHTANDPSKKPRRSPARKGWSGSSSCAQVVHTRCGSFSWNLGGSITRSRQQASQKMKPHSRQWCRSRVNGLQIVMNLVTPEYLCIMSGTQPTRADDEHVSQILSSSREAVWSLYTSSVVG